MVIKLFNSDCPRLKLQAGSADAHPKPISLPADGAPAAAALSAVPGPSTCTDCPGGIWDCQESCTTQQPWWCQTVREGWL